MSVRRRLSLFLVTGALAIMSAASAWSLWAAWSTSGGAPSVCRGTVGRGGLANAKRLPVKGANFRAYSALLWAMGRVSMHGRVRDAVAAAYDELKREAPELRFVYAEASWPRGGRLWPHRTHQNGLSVDFMVPARDRWGGIAEIPTKARNRFGYDFRFDNAGRAPGYTIDFEAIARHLAALKRAASRHGIGISLVIFENELRERLLASPGGKTLRGLPFSSKRAWIRHDNHYHVDFAVPCKAG